MRPEDSSAAYQLPHVSLLYWRKYLLLTAALTTPHSVTPRSPPLCSKWKPGISRPTREFLAVGGNKAHLLSICPFSNIFDISPIYSNLFRLTASDFRLQANPSAPPCMNYGWFMEIPLRISSAGTAGMTEVSRHVKVAQGIRLLRTC